MKRKALFGLLFFVGFEFLAFLAAAYPAAMAQSCSPVPSWVTTAPPQTTMLPPGSTFQTTVYEATNGMQPVQVNFEICGYWVNADNQPLYYAVSSRYPSTFFLFNRQSVPNG